MGVLGNDAALAISRLTSDADRCDSRRSRPPAYYAHSVRGWLDPSDRRLGVG